MKAKMKVKVKAKAKAREKLREKQSNINTHTFLVIIISSLLLSLLLFTQLALFAPLAQAIDFSPSISLQETSHISQTSTSILSATAFDFGDNAGITKIELYENNVLKNTESCDPAYSTCSKTFIIQHTTAGKRHYYAKAYDNASKTAISKTISIYFEGLNTAPKITSKSPAQNSFSVSEANLQQTFSVSAVDPQNDSLSYTWYVNSQQSQSGNSNRFTFDLPNVNDNTVYTVSVVVNDGKGRVTATNWSMTVTDTTPTGVDFSFTPQSPGIGQTISFTAVANAFDSPLTFTWNFGDGNSATGKSVTHAYSNINTYTVTLRVKDNDGDTATRSKTITVVDTIAPRVTIFSPMPMIYNITNIPLEYAVEDNDEIAECWYVLNGNRYNLSSCQNTTLSLMPLEYSLTVFARDIAGNVGSASVAFTVIDNTFPSIVFIDPTPPNGATISRNYVYINVSVTDDFGIEEVLLEWNGVNETIPQVLLNVYGINKTGLVQGNYIFKAYAIDTSNNIAETETRTITISNNPPVANDDSYTTDEDQPLSIEAPGVLANDADPDNDPLTAILITDVANGTLVFDSNGSFSYTPNPNWNGIDNFTYVVSDGIDNSSVATVTITVNSVNDAPTINLIAPANNTRFDNQQTINFTFITIDVDDTILTCTLFINDTANQTQTVNNNTETTITVSDFQKGTYTWRIECNDSQFTASSETWQFVIALHNVGVEEIKIISFNGTEITDDPAILDIGENYTISFTINNYGYPEVDPENVVIDVLLENATHSIPLVPPFLRNISQSTIENITLDTSLFALGDYNITINVTINDYEDLDLSDNLRKRAVRIIDNTQPEVTLISPANNSFNTSVIDFSWNATDNFDSNLTCYLRIYGQHGLIERTIYGYGLMNYNEDGVDEGLNEWNVTCVDDNGNEGISQTWQFVVDTTKPELTFVPPTPSNNSWLAQEWFIINVSSNELLQQAIAEIDDNNLTMSSNDNITWNVNSTGLAQGNHAFIVHGQDLAENWNSTEERTITLDWTKPTITLNIPENNLLTNQNNITFNWSVSDNLAPQLTCEFIIDGMVNQTVNLSNGESIEVYVVLSEGLHNWSVTCTDLANNTNTSETRNLTIDTTPPLWSNLSVSPSSPATYASGQSYQFNATWVDEITAIEEVIFEFNGINYSYTNGEVQRNGDIFFITLIDLPAGNYSYKWFASDSVNNSNHTPTMEYIIIQQDITEFLHLALDGTENNLTVTYPTVTNATGWSDLDVGDIIYNLYRNDNLVAQGDPASEITTLGAGIYNYVYSVIDNQNYTGNVSRILTVNKATTVLTLNATPSWNVIYGNETNVTCTANNAEVSLELYRNNTPVASGIISISDVSTLNAGTYVYVCIANESQNYTNASISNTLVVNKAQGSVTLLLNGQDSDLIITYPEQINATATTPYGTITLLRNGTNVNSENGIFVSLAAGYYNYTAISSGDENHEQAVVTRFLTINKAQSNVSLLLNGINNNITIIEGDNVNHTGILNIPASGNLTLLRNGTQFAYGLSPLTSITTYNSPGYYNITAVYGGNQNYTDASATHFISVIPAIHDVSVDSIKLSKEVDGVNKSIENTTAYLYDVIYIKANISNLGNRNETVNVSLEDNGVVVNSQVINLNVNESKEVIFTFNAMPKDWHTLRVFIPDDHNSSNNAQSQNVRVWSVKDNFNISWHSPDSNPAPNQTLGTPFYVWADVDSHPGFGINLTDVETILIKPSSWNILTSQDNDTDEKLYFNFSGDEIEWAWWHINATATGSYTVEIVLGKFDDQIKVSRQVNIN